MSSVVSCESMEGFDGFLFEADTSRGNSPAPSVKTTTESTLYCPDFENLDDCQPTELVSIELSIQESISYFGLRVNYHRYKCLKKLVYLCVLYSVSLKYLNKALVCKRGDRKLSGLPSKQYQIFCSDCNHISLSAGDGVLIFESTKHNKSKICKQVMQCSCYVRCTAEMETIIRPLQITELAEWNEGRSSLVELSNIVIPPEKGVKDKDKVLYEEPPVAMIFQPSDGSIGSCKYMHFKRHLKDAEDSFVQYNYDIHELKRLEAEKIKNAEDLASSELENYCVEGSDRHKTYLEILKSGSTEDNVKPKMRERYRKLMESKNVDMVLYWKWVDETMSSVGDGVFQFSEIQFTNEKNLIKEAEMLMYMYMSDKESIDKMKESYEKEKKRKDELKKLLGEGLVVKDQFLKKRIADLATDLPEIRSKIDLQDKCERRLKTITLIKDKVNAIKESLSVKKFCKKIVKVKTADPNPKELLKIFNPYEPLSEKESDSDDDPVSDGDSSLLDEFDWFDLPTTFNKKKRRGNLKLDERDLSDSINVMLTVERPEAIYTAVHADITHKKNSIPRLHIREPLVLLAKQIGLLRRGVHVKNINKSIHRVKGCTVKFSNGNIQRMMNLGLIPKRERALDYISRLLITSS